MGAGKLISLKQVKAELAAGVSPERAQYLKKFKSLIMANVATTSTQICYFLEGLGNEFDRAIYNIPDLDDKCVEVYLLENDGAIMFVANSVFFKFCKYSLDVLNEKPFHDLYYRDESLNEFIYKDIQSMAAQTKLMKTKTPPHVLVDKSTNFAMKMNLLYLVPLMSEPNGPVEGFVSVSDVRPHLGMAATLESFQ